MCPAELAKRWTTGFDADQIGVFRKNERECPDCGMDGDGVIVVSGYRRGADTTRRLRCSCGTVWTQVSVGEL